MRHYLRYYNAVLRISLDNFFAYRFDAFFNTIFTSGIWTLFNVFSVYLVTLWTKGAYGWKSGELILISCVYNILIGVFSFLFTVSFSRFADLIDRGTFDLYLLRPLDSQVYISTHTANVNSLFRTLLGIILAALVSHVYNINIQIINSLLFVISMLMSILLLYSCLFILNTFMIWAHRLDNITELFYTLRSLGRYPRETFRQIGEIGFIFISPFVIVMATPTRFLLGKATIYDGLELIMVTLFFFIISRLFWKFALRHYTSASS